jgi:hypothetical protein
MVVSKFILPIAGAEWHPARHLGQPLDQFDYSKGSDQPAVASKPRRQTLSYSTTSTQSLPP